MSEETTKKSKLKSVKFWVTLWAMGMVTFIVVTKSADFKEIATWLCAVPLAYLGCNVWQKKIYTDGDKE